MNSTIKVTRIREKVQSQSREYPYLLFLHLGLLLGILLLISACDSPGSGSVVSTDATPTSLPTFSPLPQVDIAANSTATTSSNDVSLPGSLATLSAMATELPFNPNIALRTPVTSEDYYQAAQLAGYSQDTQKAIDLYERAIQLDPQNAQAYEALASILMANGKCDEAITDLNTLIQIGPGSAAVTAYKNRGDAYDCKASATQRVEDYDLGIKDETTALKLNPNLPGAYTSRGVIYYHMKRYSEAIADFTSAIQSNADYADAYLDRGVVYKDQGNWDDALLDYNKYVEMRPSNWWGYYERGHVYRLKNDFKNAVADFTEVLKLYPNHEGAYVQRGQSYAGLEDYTRALEDYDKAASMAPDDPWVYTARGWVDRSTNDYERAKSDFTKAISLAPDESEAYWGRGSTYEYQEDYNNAISDYNKIVALDPKSLFANFAHIGMGRAYRELGNYALALQNFNMALAADPTSARVYVSRGITYIKQNEYAKALADFDQAEKLGDVAGAYLGRGEGYAQEGNKEEAIAAFNQAISLSGNDTSVKEDAQKELAKLQEK